MNEARKPEVDSRFGQLANVSRWENFETLMRASKDVLNQKDEKKRDVVRT